MPGMDERGSDDGSSARRIEQLERERDELRKDIEQLCLQQSGSSYLAVATRMHFQRTAGLEQEIENLKQKLSSCVRDNQNLQDELSEAYRIKSQLADLHSAEVSKNIEAEKQIKFFQGCIAAAFSERDHSLMECEKAKEWEEDILQKLSDCQNRVQELQSACLNEKKLNTALQTELQKLKEQNESFEKVIYKFYEVRERGTGCFEYKNLEDKCSCLLDDPAEMWIFDNNGKYSPSHHIASLEEELETLRRSMDNLQNKMRAGLEIEHHLRKRIQHLEKKQSIADIVIRNGFSALHDFHNQQRSAIVSILEEEKDQINLILAGVQEKMRQLLMNKELIPDVPQREEKCDDTEIRGTCISSDADSSMMSKGIDLTTTSINVAKAPNNSDALAQALQEKVDALFLLSQQEERHLLERNVNAALQNKMEELQRILSQVTNEKVMALMELAQLKQEYQLLQGNSSHGTKQCNLLADGDDKRIISQEHDGKLKYLLKKTYLRHWIGKDVGENKIDFHLNIDDSGPSNKKNSHTMDIARLKIENATLKESMANIEHLTSSVHKLRLSLLKAKSIAESAAPVGSISIALDDIILEANNVKTALGSSLPISWSAEADAAATRDRNPEDPTDPSEVSINEKVDPVSAAGFEMVELLLLAAELQKKIILTGSSSLQT